MNDFFVSYNRVDRAWAEWIAWTLEASGYSTVVQEWDFRPGENFAILMHKATKEAKQTIAILSPDYLSSSFVQPEWAAAFASDPTGMQRRLIPVRVRKCDLAGMLPQVIYIDLVDLDEHDAAETILKGVTGGRAKPLQPPAFPGDHKADGCTVPPFPSRPSNHSLRVRSEALIVRQSLVSARENRLPLEPHNDLTRKFAKLLHFGFGDAILPDSGEFSSARAPLYIQAREWLVSDAGPSTYEDHLDRLFWNDDVKMIFIEGDVGAGKSTLVDYYLRCYCPTLKSRDYDFTRKLIVNIDLRSVSTPEKLEELCYSATRRAIVDYTRKRGLDLTIDDDYAMWDPVFDWNSRVHKHASKGMAKEVYRGKLVSQRLASISDKDYVLLALRYLAELSKEKKTGKIPTYTVLCLDNLDQSPIEVHQRAIVLVKEWFDRGASLHKVFIPLWKETLSTLTEQVSPLPRYCKTVRLGRLDIGQLISRRLAYVETSLGQSAPSQFNLEPSVAEAEYLEYMHWLGEASRGNFGNLVCALCGNSARRALLLWENAVNSRALLEYHRLHSAGAHILPHEAETYCFLQALLTGSNLHHDRRRHPIANLFWTTNTASSPWDLLVGTHLIILLSRGFTSRQRIEDLLGDFGYSSSAILDALECLHAKHVLAWMSNADRDTFITNTDAVGGYLSLLTQSAYIDVMAMVTPVELGVSPHMCETGLLDATSIVKRANTSLAFLKQIHEDEQTLCHFLLSQSDSGTSLLRQAIRFPNLAKAIALKYLDHLRGIEQTTGLDLKARSEWRDLFDNRLLKDVSSLPDTLWIP